MSVFRLMCREAVRPARFDGSGRSAQPIPENCQWQYPSEKHLPRAAACAARPTRLKAPSYVEDKNSGELRRPHHVDLKTGMYRGRQILEPKETAELVAYAALGRPCAGLFVCAPKSPCVALLAA